MPLMAATLTLWVASLYQSMQSALMAARQLDQLDQRLQVSFSMPIQGPRLRLMLGRAASGEGEEGQGKEGGRPPQMHTAYALERPSRGVASRGRMLSDTGHVRSAGEEKEAAEISTKLRALAIAQQVASYVPL
eukprot:1537734-Rhodomonas_salina.2